MASLWLQRPCLTATASSRVTRCNSLLNSQTRQFTRSAIRHDFKLSDPPHPAWQYGEGLPAHETQWKQDMEQPRKIWDMDETGPMYANPHDRTMHFKSEEHLQRHLQAADDRYCPSTNRVRLYSCSRWNSQSCSNEVRRYMKSICVHRLMEYASTSYFSMVRKFISTHIFSINQTATLPGIFKPPSSQPVLLFRKSKAKRYTREYSCHERVYRQYHQRTFC